MHSRQICGCTILLLFVSALALSQTADKKQAPVSGSPEQKTAAHFESVRNQPLLLEHFLRQMPKGGDLHNHLPGAIYAESLVRYAVDNKLCVDRQTSALSAPPCDAAKGRPEAQVAWEDPMLYNQVLDAFSMRQFRPGRESGHDHFFATFLKFWPAMDGHTGEMLAEVASRSAANHLQYLELIFNPDWGKAGQLGASMKWTDDFAAMRQQLLAAGLPQIVAEAGRQLDQAEAQERELLRCGHPQADPGCGVQVRYLYEVARGLPKELVFAQILAGFEMASKDPRVVGLNLVMPEDWHVPVHDFNLHMRMLDYLHGVYPKVHISLHAGELTKDLVPPEELFHIRESILRGHAERIGHGVDVMQEQDPEALLRMMAKNKILVEICLTSNDSILGVSGMRHPLPVYLRHGVPVALATDDAGVSRSDITQEYQRAAETYHLSYTDLKKMARASIAYSFLSAPDKTRMQSALEKAFGEFEKQF
ncbi:MAG TPA: adenosine deaminase [Candidatus Angelobacter sp.]